MTCDKIGMENSYHLSSLTGLSCWFFWRMASLSSLRLPEGSPRSFDSLSLPRHLPMASPFRLLRRLHRDSRHSMFLCCSLGQDRKGIDLLAPARLTLMGLPNGKSTRSVPTPRVATISLNQVLWKGRDKAFQRKDPVGTAPPCGSKVPFKNSQIVCGSHHGIKSAVP